MSTVEDLKNFLRSNNVRGYSGKNKAQLMQMVEEYKNSEPVTNNNFFNGLPTSLISQIGTNLNYANTVKASNLGKSLRGNSLYSFQKCASIIQEQDYTNLEEYQIERNTFYGKLENLLINNPNIEFIKLSFDFDNLYAIPELVYDTQIYVISEILQILQYLKNFKKLSGLELQFVTYNKNNELWNEIYEIIGSFNLTLLSTTLHTSEYSQLKLMINQKTLKYLELFDSNLDHKDIKFNNVIETLIISGDEGGNRTIELNNFRKLKRYSLPVLDTLIIRDLINTPNLEVLEYNDYEWLESPNEWINVIKNFPIHIKYLRTGNLISPYLKTFAYEKIETMNTSESPDIYLIKNLKQLVYLYYDNNMFAGIFLLLLHIISQTNIKYFHVDRINVNNQHIKPEIFDVILPKIREIIKNRKFKLSFRELYDDEKVLVDLFPNLNYNHKESCYTMKDYYSPKQWLKDNGYLLKPECN